MLLLEYEAKEIINREGVATPSSYRIFSHDTSPTTVSFPCVIKSQVPTGGRGEAGGIWVAESKKQLLGITQALFSLSIGGYTPSSLLIEEQLEIERELYLSLSLNRLTASIELVAHAHGGVEIESRDDFFTAQLDEREFSKVGESLAEIYSLENKAFLLSELVAILYQVFCKQDAILLEINPLVLTSSGDLVTADCKMIVDDDAAFRHPDWSFEEMSKPSNYVVLNEYGTVATMANGAGLAMATVDTVQASGLVPANFLDIGGAATIESIANCFEQIVKLPKISAIVINIFGGIVRCDDVARAIIAARQQIPSLPKLYIRLAGTNANEAELILGESGITLYKTIEEAIKELSQNG
ncbi:MAG: ATP-grasp domain-containing protein [Candidatus Saccharimonas aalborgensis]